MKDLRRKKIGIALAIFVTIVLLVSYLIIKINEPHEGVVTVGTPKTAVNNFNMTPTQATGKNASFNYPTGLTVTKNNPIVYPVLEQFNFLHRDVESWNLAIAILNNPGGTVATNNSYQDRQTQPDKYKETDETINGKPVVIMTDASVGGFSKVAFLEHGNTAATISLIGDDPDGTKNLTKTFNMIISSWQWK